MLAASLHTLGPLQLRIGDAPPPRELTWSKPLALLLYLACSPRRTRTREHLIGLLWPDKPEAAARHSLDVEVARLRKHLGVSSLESAGDQLRLHADAIRLDLDELVEAQAADAAALIMGEFAEGFHVDGASAFEDWLAAERGRWKGRCIETLSDASAWHLARSETGSAVALARRAVSLDPMSERAVRALMHALAVADDRTAALRAWKAHVDLVNREGILPSRALASLAGRISAERDLAPGTTSRPAAADRRAPLVGRQRELAALLDALDAATGPACLLIIGDAGTGRTRLADEVSLRARLNGSVTFLVRCMPDDRTRPWSGWQAIAASGLATAPGVSSVSPRALGTMIRENERWREQFPELEQADEAFDRRTALAEVLAAVAGEQPVLVVIDDAQWIDTESLGALESAVRHASAPIALLLTMLPQPPRNDLDAIRARLGRDWVGTSVTLGPLEGAELQALVARAFPALAAPEQARIARRVEADSAGLPLLAVELLHAAALGLEIVPRDKAWLDQGRTLDQTLPGDLPDSIVAATRIGFSVRSPDARLLLEALAILPGRQPADVLATMAGLDLHSAATALDELEYARWVNADARGYAYLANVIRLVVERDMVTGGKRRRMLERLKAGPGPLPR